MSDKLDKASVSTLTALLACLFYGFVSTSITFFNKAVLASYDFKSPNIMTLFQILFSLLFLISMKSFNRIHYPDITWQMSIKVPPHRLTRLLPTVTSPELFPLHMLTVWMACVYG